MRCSDLLPTKFSATRGIIYQEQLAGKHMIPVLESSAFDVKKIEPEHGPLVIPEGNWGVPTVAGF
jgi:hypothetical protein